MERIYKLLNQPISMFGRSIESPQMHILQSVVRSSCLQTSTTAEMITLAKSLSTYTKVCTQGLSWHLRYKIGKRREFSKSTTKESFLMIGACGPTVGSINMVMCSILKSVWRRVENAKFTYISTVALIPPPLLARIWLGTLIFSNMRQPMRLSSFSPKPCTTFSQTKMPVGVPVPPFYQMKTITTKMACSRRL